MEWFGLFVFVSFDLNKFLSILIEPNVVPLKNRDLENIALDKRCLVKWLGSSQQNLWLLTSYSKLYNEGAKKVSVAVPDWRSACYVLWSVGAIVRTVSMVFDCQERNYTMFIQTFCFFWRKKTSSSENVCSLPQPKSSLVFILCFLPRLYNVY